jgi:hypothetical protein
MVSYLLALELSGRKVLNRLLRGSHLDRRALGRGTGRADSSGTRNAKLGRERRSWRNRRCSLQHPPRLQNASRIYRTRDWSIATARASQIHSKRINHRRWETGAHVGGGETAMRLGKGVLESGRRHWEQLTGVVSREFRTSAYQDEARVGQWTEVRRPRAGVPTEKAWTPATAATAARMRSENMLIERCAGKSQKSRKKTRLSVPMTFEKSRHLVST